MQMKNYALISMVHTSFQSPNYFEVPVLPWKIYANL